MGLPAWEAGAVESCWSDKTSACPARTKTDFRRLTVRPQQGPMRLGDADHTPWLDRLADMLRSAAGVDDQSPDAATSASGSTDVAGIESVPTPAYAEALALAAQAELMAARDMEELAVVAATVTKAAVDAAATHTQQAADAARDAQSAAATKIAVATAETVRRTAHLLQLQTDEEAERVARTAEEAAKLVALAVVPGTEAVNAETAAFLAATIRAAAVARAEETALAAATVARAAAAAAAEAAAIAADAAMALELQVADTAAAVQADATATARRVAADQVTAADLVLSRAKVAEAEITRRVRRTPGRRSARLNLSCSAPSARIEAVRGRSPLELTRESCHPCALEHAGNGPAGQSGSRDSGMGQVASR